MNEKIIIHDPVFGVVIMLDPDGRPAPLLPAVVRRIVARCHALWQGGAGQAPSSV